MKLKLFENKITNEIISGLTAAMLTGAYSLCICGVLGFDLWHVLFCSIICFLLSFEMKKAVYSPDAFLLLPVLYMVSSGIKGLLPVVAVSGTLIALLLNKLLKNKEIPSYVFAGGGIGIALVVTILLTNNYFGIGASGATAFDMLKSYRSLGFHPDFRGLLYGTVTLFAMITYPFKFKKLNKTLPAEFMTLLIPLILNLFLNPMKELTTINELESFNALSFSDLSYEFTLTPVTPGDISTTIKASVIFGVLVYLYSFKSKETENVHFLANCGSTFVTGIPVRAFPVKSFTLISLITAIISTVAIIVFLPDVLSRIPMHCAGALLIVSAWQNVPYKKVAAAFKENIAVALLITVVSVVIFVTTELFTAIVFCLLCTLIPKKYSVSGGTKND